jgi:hypothetical protein
VIVGLVVGGLVVIVLAVAVILLWQRRHRRAIQSPEGEPHYSIIPIFWPTTTTQLPCPIPRPNHHLSRNGPAPVRQLHRSRQGVTSLWPLLPIPSRGSGTLLPHPPARMHPFQISHPTRGLGTQPPGLLFLLGYYRVLNFNGKPSEGVIITVLNPSASSLHSIQNTNDHL